VYSYLKQKDPATKVPQVQIRELRTSSLDEMDDALRALEGGMPFETVVEKWSNDGEARKRKGLSEFFPITERPPIGEIASHMDIGQRYGPVRMNDGVLVFELVAKRDAVLPSDTSSASGMEKAAGEVLAMKQRRTLDLFLAQLGGRYGYTIYQDRLLRIPVTPVPMMTFRILGFGGRMFAVPFVEKQLDWLNIEPPSSIIVP
jgi:parvulin-like peptidyl-prolyl isomerase